MLIPTIIIAFLPSFFHLSNTDGDNSVADYAVYCIGDSLTAAGYYETELAALLGSQFTVVNKGINGDTTSGMLNRFTTDVLNHDPDFVVIWGGVNDIAWAGLSLATTESNLQSMYTQARNADIKVIAISMSPWKGTSTWTVAKQVSTDSLHDWIVNTAINIDYRVEVYHPLENGYTDYFLPAYDSGDHLHFNNAAGVVIGQAIYDAVFAMHIPVIAQPSNLAPAHGAISVSRTPTLQSSGFSCPYAGETHTASQWQITKLAGNYASPVFDSGTEASYLTSIVAPPLSYSTQYWHVRYQGSDGAWSSWSSETSFVISSPPSQPTSVWPASGASCATLTPTLRASAFSDLGEGDSHAASQWQITTVAGDYSTPIFDSTVDTSDLTRITIPYRVLNKHTTCYWRVRYKDNHGVWSDWSTDACFTRPEFVSVELHSPGELRAYDPQGRVTGWVNGVMKEEIPGSDCYYSYAVVICSPIDSYAYEVVGTGEGKYGLTITWQNGEGSREFTAVGISISAKTVHEYTVDWAALSNAEEGVVVRVDSQGNGKYERRVVASAALTQMDFEPVANKGLPLWIWIVIGVAMVLALPVSAPYVYRRVSRKDVVLTEPTGVLQQVGHSDEYLMEEERVVDFSNQVVKAAWDRQGGRCASCGRWLNWSYRGRDSVVGAWQSHHITPRDQGGSGALVNCVIFCSGIANCHFNVGHGGIWWSHYAPLEDPELLYLRNGHEAAKRSPVSYTRTKANLVREVLGIRQIARAKKPSAKKQHLHQSRGRTVSV